jgi:deazaflavin-dependent oxidoreductase (nitroreductase family)
LTLSHADFEEKTRQAFKILNRFMLFFWRLGLGFWFKWPRAFGCIMVIIHRGRKTGLLRRTPVNFAMVENDLFCTAAYGAEADWYKNILADPNVEVWLPDGWWRGIAEDVTDAENASQILRQVLIGSGFAARVFGLNPYELSEDQLDTIRRKYRLIRIHRTEAMTGSGGPGDLAWLWQLASMFLLLILLFRKKSHPSKKINS